VLPITKAIIKLNNLYCSLPKNVISDFEINQQFRDTMHNQLWWAVWPYIIPENVLHNILTIAEKYDATNHATSVYRYLESKQIASNALTQAKPKPQLLPIKTSNNGYTQCP
jgi:hypothetical protein